MTHNIDDPIFALIDAHRAAEREYGAAIEARSKIEERVPYARREKNAAWLAAEKRVDRVCRKPDQIADAMIRKPPRTLAGIVALLQYAVEYVDQGNIWPEASPPELRDWAYFLHEALACRLGELIGRAGETELIRAA